MVIKGNSMSGSYTIVGIDCGVKQSNWLWECSAIKKKRHNGFTWIEIWEWWWWWVWRMEVVCSTDHTICPLPVASCAYSTYNRRSSERTIDLSISTSMNFRLSIWLSCELSHWYHPSFIWSFYHLFERKIHCFFSINRWLITNQSLAIRLISDRQLAYERWT